jgi:YVTN family beta-propeller protein
MTVAMTALQPVSAADDQAPLYKITSTVPLGAPERWDYLVFDADSGRVYVAHGSEVSVVDGRSGTVIGTIEPFPGGTHGIGISTATHTGYTDDGKAGVAVPFDLTTLKTGTPIPTAPDADGIVRDPASGHIFVINGDSGSITAIDPAKNAVVATIAAGGGLEFGLVDGKGNFFVDGAEHNEIIRINTATNTIEAHWPMADCKSPHGIAMDMATRRLFASCANNVMVVVDADSGKNLATLPIGSYNDGAAFDPVRKLALASNGDGTLTVVREKDANTFVVVGTVKTPLSARTIDIDQKTGRVFLAAADIAKIDPPAKPGGRPHVEFVPGSLKLLILDPAI